MQRAFSGLLLIAALVACNESRPSSNESPALVSNEKAETALNANAELKQKQFKPQEVKSERAAKAKYPFRYYVKDGKITYTYSGDQEGTETVYFTDYGMTEIKHTTTTRKRTFSEGLEEINLITLMRDSFIYVVDKNSYNARRIDNSALYQIAEQHNTLDLNQAAENVYRAYGGHVLGIDTVAGMPAEKWNMQAQRQTEWRWKGIMAKTLMENNSSYIKIAATEIDTSFQITEDLFQLPKSINITDGTPLDEWIRDLQKPLPKRQVFDNDGNQVNK